MAETVTEAELVRQLGFEEIIKREYRRATDPTWPVATARAITDYLAAITDAEIDAGAAALRKRLQGGKKLRPWLYLPTSVKRKWRDYATCVLTAARKGSA
jgi:hypothetical protein